MNPVRPYAAFAVCLWCLLVHALATTVIPPTLDELVAQSDTVIRTRALNTRCAWRGTGEERHIVTLVTFAVDESVVGTSPGTVELEFFGGELDGERMFIAGQPRFAPGHEDILFVSRETNTFTPLVRMMYGRYPVITGEAGAQFMARVDGEPLTTVEQVASPLGEASHAAAMHVLGAAALTPAQFCDAIRASARRLGRTDVPAAAGGQLQ